MKTTPFLLSALVLTSASGLHAADILRLSGSTDLSDTAYWTGGALPGSADVASFDGTSGAGGTTYSTGSGIWPGGWKITDVGSTVTFSGVQYVYGSGVDMSAADADAVFGNIRNNSTGGGGAITIASGRTLTTDYVSTAGGKSWYTLSYSGGGTLIVNNSLAGNSSRLMLDVSGAGTTIGGTGTYAPWWSNTTFGIRMGDGTIIAPGNSIGTLTIDSANDFGSEACVIMADGSGFEYELGGGGGSFVLPGNSDLITLLAMEAGDVKFEGTSNIDFLGTGSWGVFKLFDTDLDGTTWEGLTLSGQEITGGLTFSNLTPGYTGTLIMGDGVTGDAGDIYIQVVPEPTAALLGGLGLLGLLRRRRG